MCSVPRCGTRGCVVFFVSVFYVCVRARETERGRLISISGPRPRHRAGSQDEEERSEGASSAADSPTPPLWAVVCARWRRGAWRAGRPAFGVFGGGCHNLPLSDTGHTRGNLQSEAIWVPPRDIDARTDQPHLVLQAWLGMHCLGVVTALPLIR